MKGDPHHDKIAEQVKRELPLVLSQLPGLAHWFGLKYQDVMEMSWQELDPYRGSLAFTPPVGCMYFAEPNPKKPLKK